MSNGIDKTIGTLLVILLLSGCSRLGGVIEIEARPELTYKRDPYVLGIGDQLLVDVWRNPELTRSLLVRPDGFITMPLMGDIKAESQTPEALASIISDSLKHVIKNPEVSVTVTNPVSVAYQYQVRVMGQVRQPISISFSEGITVMDLVLAAGGINAFGAGNRAILNRLTDSGYEEYKIRISDILNHGDISTNYLLQPSDIIIVPEKKFWRGEL